MKIAFAALLFAFSTASFAQPGVDPAVAIKVHALPVPQLHELRRLDLLSKLGFFGEVPLDQCVVPPQTAAGDVDLHRSLFVHDRATLDTPRPNEVGGFFSLKRTLDQIASQATTAMGTNVSSPAPTGLSIFRQLWDTQNAAPGLSATSPHCTDNGGTVNGFPYSCRPEGQEANDTTEATMSAYRVVGLVNRLDLAHEGWRNCGEYRIIYAKPENGFLRNLVIFEAVLPNPKPGCREGCMDVARFWRDLTANNDPADRASKLSDFFYNGLPGYRPVVHVDHYSSQGVTGSYGSSGSGQIRTNQFLGAPWILKEFKTVIDCGASPCRFDLVPIMVKVNPHGELWNEDVANGTASFAALAKAFQGNILNAATIQSLSNSGLLRFGYSVDLTHDAAESISLPTATFKDNYLQQFQLASGPVNVFRNNLAAAGMANNLTSAQLVNRAMTQSCAGCHKPGTFGLETSGSLGSTISPAGPASSWPSDAGFTHVHTEISALPEFSGLAAFGNGQGNALSPALLQAFLPDRKNFLLSQLNMATCACAVQFKGLSPAVRAAAIKVQERVNMQLQARIKQLERDVVSLDARDAPARTRLEKRITSLEQERTRMLAAELKKANITLPSEAVKAEPLKLRISRKNPAAEAAARQAAVLKILEEEPPRRTVTGSFTVH